MSDTSQHLEERIRSVRLFKLSVIVGVIGGGLFGAGVELGLQFFFDQVDLFDIRMIFVYGLIFLSIVFMIFAIRTSEAIYSWTYTLEIRQPSTAFATLIRGALDESNAYPSLTTSLTRHLTILQDQDSYERMTIEDIRNFVKDLQRIRSTITNIQGSIIKHLSAIANYPKKLQNLEKGFRKGMIESSVFRERDWDSIWNKDELRISQSIGYFKSIRIMSILLQNNIKNSVFRPFLLTVGINYPITLKDLVEAESSLQFLFSELIASEDALEFNLEVIYPQEEASIERMKRYIREPILDGMKKEVREPIIAEVRVGVKDTIVRRIGAFEDEIKKQIKSISN